MRRRAAAFLLALAALAALPAAKPVAPDAPAGAPDDSRQRLRGQGISLCVAELRAVPELSPDDLESICGCAVDRTLTGLRNLPNPQIEVRGVLGAHMVGCTAQVRPDRTSDVARRRAAILRTPAPAADSPAADMPAADAVVEGKPTDADAAPADSGGASGESAGGGFWDWLTNWSWPAWLTGASVLWWIAGGIFLLGLLILKIRRHDPRQDLAAPPSYMRRGAPPQPPRRPDLPR